MQLGAGWRVQVAVAFVAAVAAGSAPAGAQSAPTASRRALDAEMGNDLAHNQLYAQHTSAEFDACSKKADGVTSEMLDCGSAEFDRLDRLLNATYRRKMAGLSPSRRAVLQASERKWVAGREAYCDGYVTPNGGSAQLLFQSTCYLNTTIHRTLFVRRFK